MSPALKFNEDVDVGVDVASPGRTDRNPFADGCTTVTFNNRPVAPAGTGCCVPLDVDMNPATCNFCDTADTNGPGNPRSVRVSRIRIGSIVITHDGVLDAALTAISPPPPKVTARAAPIAAHRDLHRPRRSIVAAAISPSPGVGRSQVCDPEDVTVAPWGPSVHPAGVTPDIVIDQVTDEATPDDVEQLVRAPSLCPMCSATVTASTS
jgi:hypothetical protein